MSSKYFSALEFDKAPSWYTNLTTSFDEMDWHPHVTVHYFGRLERQVAEDISRATQPWREHVFTLRPTAIKRFGPGLALTFDQDSELDRLELVRSNIGKVPVVAPNIDMMFPTFRAHMSLPAVALSVKMLTEPLVLTGPVLIEKRTSLVRA